MTLEAAGTTAAAGSEAQSAGAGTPPPDEVTTLRSRNAGLDAKVTALTANEKAASERAAAAERKLADYEAGKVGADEALRAQLAAEQANTQAAKLEAKIARIEGKFPETYALFGAAVAGMADETLAASEARLKGVAAADEEPPTPTSHNEPKAGTTSSGKPKDESADDVQARLLSMESPW